MTGAWDVFLPYYFRVFTHKACFNDREEFVDVELGVLAKIPRRVDSGISLGSLDPVSSDYTVTDSGFGNESAGSILLAFDFGEESYIKALDYGTFARWDAMKGLIEDIESDGAVIEQLWDTRESMMVSGGDWDARVCHEWSIHVRCMEARRDSAIELSDESDSEACDSNDETLYDAEAEEEDDWCLARWRRRVEQQRSMHEHVQEPSWIMLVLGSALVICFVITVLVYTA